MKIIDLLSPWHKSYLDKLILIYTVGKFSYFMLQNPTDY